VYLKVGAEATARGVMGYPVVYTYTHPYQNLAEMAYLNRPTACAVNPDGDLLFADTWNHRIRKFSRYYQKCHTVSGSLTAAELDAYLKKLEAVASHCSAAYAPDVIKTIQQDLLKFSTTSFETHFCNLPGE